MKNGQTYRNYRNFSNLQSTGEIWDVFISHASEDKDDLVRPLAMALKQHKLTVWYDEIILRIGESLRERIDNGLSNSRVGLVILSSSFINKDWTTYELNAIITRSISGGQLLLPIWHNITKQQVVDFSPSLADIVARSTAKYTINDIANEIASVLHDYKIEEQGKRITF